MFKSEAEQRRAFEDWGFTNDPKHFDLACAYRERAIQDGWTPKDETGEHFTKDGFVMHILARDEGEERRVYYRYTTTVHIWGPDGLCIEPPQEYDWYKIQAGLRRCNYCHKENVPTGRVGFAGRCCEACIPEVRKKVEYPGWTN